MVQRRILMVILVALLAIPTVSGSAQTPIANAIPAEDELPGLHTSILRSYAPAGSFESSGTVVREEATPISREARMTQVRSISVVIREFDTAENAAAAYEQIIVGAEASMPAIFQNGTQEIASKDLAGIGAQARLIRAEHTGQSNEYWLEYVIAQRDQYVLFVSADRSVWRALPASGEIDLSLPTVAIAADIAAHGNAGTGLSVFREDGTSAGGLWEFMPPADAPLLMGLVPVQDAILYPTIHDVATVSLR